MSLAILPLILVYFVSAGFVQFLPPFFWLVLSPLALVSFLPPSVGYFLSPLTLVTFLRPSFG